ncbi:hypothetical protein HYV86_04315 [Candidatus Woesearchaeota archaeon]|nr:hypothetical protein [Candidatus Woesearchaeota archaeon]
MTTIEDMILIRQNITKIERNASLSALEVYTRLEPIQVPHLEEKLLENSIFPTKEAYQTGFSELKKYLAIAATSAGPVAMTSQEVDATWHQFILFTREYTQFCSDNLGRYIHHEPNTSTTTLSDMKASIENFVQAYETNFGRTHPIWNLSEYTADCTGSSCQSVCNAPSCYSIDKPLSENTIP